MPSAKYYAAVGLMLNGRHGLCVSYSSILCRQAFKLVMKSSANYLNDIIPGMRLMLLVRLMLLMGAML